MRYPPSGDWFIIGSPFGRPAARESFWRAQTIAETALPAAKSQRPWDLATGYDLRPTRQSRTSAAGAIRNRAGIEAHTGTVPALQTRPESLSPAAWPATRRARHRSAGLRRESSGWSHTAGSQKDSSHASRAAMSACATRSTRKRLVRSSSGTGRT